MVGTGTIAKSEEAVASARMDVCGAIARSVEALPSAHMVVSGPSAKSAEAVPSARMVGTGTSKGIFATIPETSAPLSGYEPTEHEENSLPDEEHSPVTAWTEQ